MRECDRQPVRWIALLGMCGLLAMPKAEGQESRPGREVVSEACKKLAAADNYSWDASPSGGGERAEGDQPRGKRPPQGRGAQPGQARPEWPGDGKSEKGGLTLCAVSVGGSSVEVAVKGGVLILDGTWKTPEEVLAGASKKVDPGANAGGGNQGGRMMPQKQVAPPVAVARSLAQFKKPAQEAVELLATARSLKEEGGGAYSGVLAPEAVVTLLQRGAQASGDKPPKYTNPIGSVRFLVKDGLLAKYEYAIKGTTKIQGGGQGGMGGFGGGQGGFGGGGQGGPGNQGGEPREVTLDYGLAIEIKDVGSTTVTPPEGLLKRLK